MGESKHKTNYAGQDARQKPKGSNKKQYGGLGLQFRAHGGVK